METTFNNLVEEIQKLNTEQKEELKFLLEKYLIEERREEIYENFIEAKQKVKENKLKFTSSIDELKLVHLEEEFSNYKESYPRV